MRIAVAGTGYVGLSLAVLLSQHNHVTAVDIVPEKVEMLNNWKSPIQDEYIEKFLAEHEERGLDLTATTDGASAYADAEFVIIAAPTNYDPQKNFFDCSAVEAVIDLVLKSSKTATMIIKSTIPVGYTESVRKKFNTDRIIFSPEFLRESKALYDNLYPSRIIVGCDEKSRENAEKFAALLVEGAEKENIPFVDWKKYNTQYSDGEHNAWEFFFQQPSKLSYDEVYHSKNVILSGWTYKDKNPKGYFGAAVFHDERIRKKCSELLLSNIQFSNEVMDIVNQELNIIDIENCVGVYIRGTDYVKLKPSGEYVQPNVSQIIPVIRDFLIKHSLNNIFLVTEDGEIYDRLKEEFQERIKIVSYDSFIRGYNGNKVLSKTNLLDDNKKLRGQHYLAKMILLSKCGYLVSSITQGSKFSYLLNNGGYIDKYIFDLGLYA